MINEQKVKADRRSAVFYLRSPATRKWLVCFIIKRKRKSSVAAHLFTVSRSFGAVAAAVESPLISSFIPFLSLLYTGLHMIP